VFVLSDVHGTQISREEMGDLRLQEGTWVVVNSLLNDEGQPRAAWEIVRGRLGVIHVISDAQITVQLGGTPGGLYRLLKQGAARGRQLDWSDAYFDLVVVDEASQMNLAEALTAAAFLRDDGQFLAVGDHRQMPPILQHAWDQASRRDLARARPHLSLFASLLELGFARTALDESFRLPAEVAAFLHRHVYAHDGIAFHSKNRQRLPAVELAGGWPHHALAPEHPIILIEHNDDSSQQTNTCEALVIEALAQTAIAQLRLDAHTGLGIVVPYRAQKALLQTRLPSLAGAVDMVERFQGGERELIIVSATVSDLAYAQSESDFLLEPRRLTVAVSRPKRKLIVLASQALCTLIPADLDDYERGALWKHLRHGCASPPLWTGEYGGYRLRVLAIKTTETPPILVLDSEDRHRSEAIAGTGNASQGAGSAYHHITCPLGRHRGSILTVPHVHSTMVPVYHDPEKRGSDSQHVSPACTLPDRGLTAAGGVSAVCCYQPCTGTGGAARDARGLTGLAASLACHRRRTTPAA
jgi:hypothetical protein